MNQSTWEEKVHHDMIERGKQGAFLSDTFSIIRGITFFGWNKSHVLLSLYLYYSKKEQEAEHLQNYMYIQQMEVTDLKMDFTELDPILRSHYWEQVYALLYLQMIK